MREKLEPYYGRLDCRYVKANVGETVGGKKLTSSNLPKDILEDLTAFYELDIELYEWAKASFQEAYSAKRELYNNQVENLMRQNKKFKQNKQIKNSLKQTWSRLKKKASRIR